MNSIASGNLDGSGVTTNYHYDNAIFYTTTEIDEVILFVDKDGNSRLVNDWIIFADQTDLLVQLVTIKNGVNTFSDIIPIGSNSSWADGKVRIDGIKIIGIVGQKVKWIGNSY